MHGTVSFDGIILQSVPGIHTLHLSSAGTEELLVSTNISICASGSYLQKDRSLNDVTYGGRCELCPAGFYKELIGIFSCSVCPKGHECPRGSVHAKQCPPGKVAPKDQQSQCTDCKLGEYRQKPGGKSCEKCPRGFITDETHLRDICMQCSPGESH